MNRRSPPALLAIACMVLVTACSAPPASTPMPTPEPMSEAPSAGATSDAGPTDAPTSEATSSPSPEVSEAPADALLAIELTDVRSGDTFTLATLAADHGPVLLEPMAVWCSSCRAQQREVMRAHELGSFTSVSLDVELTEDPEDLAAYAEREGFDWRFAMADAALYRLLQERFTPAATNPPSTPLIIIEGDGTVRFLEPGVGIRSAEQLLDELGAG
jgi:hypothetical protein